MKTVTALRTFPGSVHDAETRWYDTDGWPSWVEGLSHIVERSADWPAPGSRVVWQSGPAGRGQVTERVVAHEALHGQTVEVEDDAIRGRQSVDFIPDDGTVEVALTLSYEIKRRSWMTPVIDLLFIRRAMAASLQTTLVRFGSELGAGR